MSSNYPNGSRQQYLIELAEEMGLSRASVFTLASVLGPDEDFDGLVTMLEDAVDSGEFDDD